ncbi:phage tail family protein [Mammaliicoccus fleurettii]|uniref:phage distal tail protein n=1 Tax=Mammaliicoccus fleurettii TaxID=150056 RepID=UPI002DBA0476|nr:phage tail domain-containing protein [Mammaliicoccus fleurettii]MEB7779267.1 phage tail family protein [Mammaliicoccus fleurettii]
MIETVIIDGKELPWLIVERGFNIPSFNFITEREKINGRAGSVKKSRQLDEYEIEIPMIVRNDYISPGGTKNHDEILHDLVRFLNYDNQVKFQFSSQDWYWNVYIDGPIELPLNTEGKIIQFTLKLILTDSYKYKVDGNQNTAISDQVSVVNSGTTDTPIIVEARALKNSSYFMIAKGDKDYFMIGDDDVDVPSQDYSPSIYSTEMTTLTGWTKQGVGSVSDNYTGGLTGGSFQLSSTKNSATILNYPEGTGWIGSLYKRSYSKSAQDFSVTVKIAVTQKKKGTARFAQYIYDTDNRLLASIGYVNPSAKQTIGRIIVTLFNQNGDQVKIYDYKNTPPLYNLGDLIVYMRLVRKGNTFTIKTWKYKDVLYPERITPIDSHTKTYIDKGNFYQRPVSSLGLYLAKHSSSDFMTTYILGTYNRELLPKPTNARDMIIKQGDLVTVDTATQNVLVNDEPFLQEKTFGSNFFNVDDGYNELMIYPENTFDTNVKWQDRYL